MFNIDLGNKKNKIAKLSTIADEDIPMTVDEDTPTVPDWQMYYDCVKDIDVKARPTLLPHIVYYNDDHSYSLTCTEEISKQMGVTYSLPMAWSELTREIESGRYKIVFHIDMISKSGETIKKFINSINTIIKFMPNHEPLKIMVLITPKTSQYEIKQLKDCQVHCIGLDMNYYPMDEVALCVKGLLGDKQHFPEHIISQLPDTPPKPIHVLFRNEPDRNLYPAMQGAILAIQNLGLKVLCCNSWDELSEALREFPHQIVAHVDMISHSGVTIHEFLSMIETLVKLTVGKPIPLAIVIEKDTPLTVVKELQKTSVMGIIPSGYSFGIDEGMRGVTALTNRIPYWPKHILQQLPGNPRKQPDKHSFELTSRQQEVYNLISTRGLSNKQIARSLSISESTVKLHITEIFKKYGVRNRTQLAVFSHS